MQAFPANYEGMITEIHTCFGNARLRYFAKREDVLTEILGASPETYLQEFPGRKIEVVDPSKPLAQEEIVSE